MSEHEVDRNMDSPGAIVTGGGGGIGRVVCLELARASFQVLVADLREEAASQVANEARAAGGRSVALPVNLCDESQVARMVDRAVAEFDSLEVLVNCVGTNGIHSPLRDLAVEEWDRVMAINLKAVFLACKAVAGYMADRGRGSIVNFASRAGATGSANNAQYAVSKAGVIALTKSLARELAPKGVTVNAIAPGTVNTIEALKLRGQEGMRRAGQENPLGRIAEPQDIAAAVLFLVGEGSRYITGQTLHVNGGSLMA